MEKQGVYTLSNVEDIGAFQEDALPVADVVEAVSVSAGSIDAMMADLLNGMKTLAANDARRQEVTRLLVWCLKNR